MSIEVMKREFLDRTYMPTAPEGERAFVKSQAALHEGVQFLIKEQIEEVFQAASINLIPLTSIGGSHTYILDVRGTLTVEGAVEIIEALIHERFDWRQDGSISEVLNRVLPANDNF